MSLLTVIRRATGKSPRYLVRRGVIELRRRVNAGRLRRTLDALTLDDVRRVCGGESLKTEFLASIGSLRLTPAAAEAHRARYRSEWQAEGSALAAQADRLVRHEFDLLGSGPVALGPVIDWHRDFKSGIAWPAQPASSLDLVDLSRPSDVKVPWELSRFQHWTRLAQAHVVTGRTDVLATITSQLDAWCAANPPGIGVNWGCTMDVALRAVSWTWTLALLADAPLPDAAWDRVLFALYQHGLWIPEHLEVGEVNGNHYISDALGMVACGAAFSRTPVGRTWLEHGARLLEQEIRLQIDEDGTDIEASVPYHRLVLEIFLVGARMLDAVGAPVSAEYRRRLDRAIAFVDAYTTPDGLSPVVGDADDGRALVLGATDVRDHRYVLATGAALYGHGEWKARAGRLWEDTGWFLGPEGAARFDALAPGPLSSGASFPHAGFFTFRTGEHYAFFDAGPVGFKGIGGHGHNDCLSVEWHAYARPVLTDSGAFVYTAAPDWRNRFRSTAAHSTIRVDEQEINRFFSPLALWTLRNDARPLDTRRHQDDEWEVVEGGHGGYQRLADPVTVYRGVAFHRQRAELALHDRVEATSAHTVEFFFHLAPGLALAERGRDGLRLAAGSLSVELQWTSPHALEWHDDEGWFSPSYGVKIPRLTLRAVVRAAGAVDVHWMWRAAVAA